MTERYRAVFAAHPDLAPKVLDLSNAGNFTGKQAWVRVCNLGPDEVWVSKVYGLGTSGSAMLKKGEYGECAVYEYLNFITNEKNKSASVWYEVTAWA